MNIKEKIAHHKEKIEKHTEHLKEHKEDLKSIESLRQPSIYEERINDMITIKESVGDYEYILGGDGRSAPWSEIRTGSIATVNTNEGLYFSAEQINIIKKHVSQKTNCDHVEVIVNRKTNI